MSAHEDRRDDRPTDTGPEGGQGESAAPPEPREIVPDPTEAAAAEPEAPTDAFAEHDHWVRKDDSNDDPA
ncbi:MAG: hypothetical protein ACRDN9_09555 [Streptosporangiaceae bacterium]